MLKLPVIILYLFAASFNKVFMQEWCYSNCEVAESQWSQRFTNCKGSEQSPIDLPSNARNSVLGVFTYDNYAAKQTNLLVANSGHTVKVTLQKGPSLLNGGLQNTYAPIQLHFHWGATNNNGSEHTVNGQAFPMEMHIVHQDEMNNLAVLGVLFTISTENNTEFQPIVNALSQIQYPDNTTNTMSDISLFNLLPERSGANFWRYNGSLTTPECNEKVIWSVFKATQNIGQTQINEFRKLMGHNGLMSDNRRSIQKLNSRTVLFNEVSGSCEWRASSSGILALLLMSVAKYVQNKQP